MVENVTVKEFESDLRTARTVDLERYKMRARSELNTFFALSCLSQFAPLWSLPLTRVPPLHPRPPLLSTRFLYDSVLRSVD